MSNLGRSSRATSVGLKPSPWNVGVLVVLAVSFAAFSLAGHPRAVIAHLALWPRRAFWPEPWQLITNALLHGTFGALFSSAIGIWLFGTPVEQKAGRAHLFKIL